MHPRPQDRMSSLRLLTLLFYFFLLFFISYFNFTSQTKMSVLNFDKKKTIVSQNKRGLKVVAENANNLFQNFNMTFRTRAFNTLVTKFRLVLCASEKMLSFNTRIPQKLFDHIRYRSIFFMCCVFQQRNHRSRHMIEFI